MKARLIFHSRRLFDDGAVMEMKIWQVQKPVLASQHSLKYSLFYGYPGQRLVGYDNERGKGDHKHLSNVEMPYDFASVEKLVADFMADVGKLRGV
jgi:hypothetical protein